MVEFLKLSSKRIPEFLRFVVWKELVNELLKELLQDFMDSQKKKIWKDFPKKKKQIVSVHFFFLRNLRIIHRNISSEIHDRIP